MAQTLTEVERARPADADLDRRPRYRRHPLALAVAVALAWLLTLAVAFELGHAYAEGVRSLGGFLDHLGELREHLLGGEEMSVAGWLWLNGWLW